MFVYEKRVPLFALSLRASREKVGCFACLVGRKPFLTLGHFDSCQSKSRCFSDSSPYLARRFSLPSSSLGLITGQRRVRSGLLFSKIHFEAIRRKKMNVSISYKNLFTYARNPIEAKKVSTHAIKLYRRFFTHF